MKIGNVEFSGKTRVMAIINLTPDSFYAPSRRRDDALFAVGQAIEDGAAIVDIGAQSTRPGYTEVGCEEELKRLIKPLEEIKKRFSVPVSVDTYFSRVAREALDCGAEMINDVSGLRRDEDMASTVAEYGAAVCVMHNAELPKQGDMWGAIDDFLSKSVEKALSCGVEKERIILDGGIGFKKTREQNFELLEGYERLKTLGFPLLLGTSRKSMFGGTPEGRLSATLESTVKACEKGVLFVRVHDVKENVKQIENFYKNRLK